MASTDSTSHSSGHGKDNYTPRNSAASRSSSSSSSSSRPMKKKTHDVEVRSVDSSVSSSTLVSRLGSRSWKQKLFAAKTDTVNTTPTTQNMAAKTVAPEEKRRRNDQNGRNEKARVLDQLERKYPQLALSSPAGFQNNAGLL